MLSKTILYTLLYKFVSITTAFERVFIELNLKKLLALQFFKQGMEIFCCVVQLSKFYRIGSSFTTFSSCRVTQGTAKYLFYSPFFQWFKICWLDSTSAVRLYLFMAVIIFIFCFILSISVWRPRLLQSDIFSIWIEKCIQKILANEKVLYVAQKWCIEMRRF